MPLYAMESPKKSNKSAYEDLVAAVQHNNTEKVITLVENGIDSLNREDLLRMAESNGTEPMLKALTTTLAPSEIKRALPTVIKSIYEQSKISMGSAATAGIILKPKSVEKVYESYKRDENIIKAIAQEKYQLAKKYLPQESDEAIKSAIQNSMNRVIAKVPEIREALDHALLTALVNWKQYDDYGKVVENAQTLRGVQTLLALGADPNAIDIYGFEKEKIDTPLFAARRKGLPISITLLIEAGADKSMDLNAPLRALHGDAKYRDKQVLFDSVMRVSKEPIKRAFLTAVSPKDVKHIIPGIIALTKHYREAGLPKDMGNLIASHIVPDLLNEKLTLAKKYAYKPIREEAALRNSILESFKRVMRKSINKIPAFITLSTEELTTPLPQPAAAQVQHPQVQQAAPDYSLRGWAAWLFGTSSK